MTSWPTSNGAREFESKRWAAEELALQLGWLSECPYHGEPFKRIGPFAAPPHDDGAVSGARELYSLAAEISSGYGERCSFCERENVLPE